MINQTLKYNTTNQVDSTPSNWQSTLWVASLSINILLTILAIWLAATISIYGQKSGKFQRKRKSDYSGGTILKLALLASLVVIPRLATTNIILWVGFDVGKVEDYNCEIAVDVSIVVYYIALYPAYIFLWMRQRSLFQQPSLQRLYNVFVKIISWGCLFFLIGAGSGVLLIFILPLSYRSSPDGCILRDEEEDNVVAFYAVSVVLVVGQLTLLGLFIYPLHRHRHVQVVASSTRKKTSISRISSFKTTRRSNRKSEKQVSPCYKLPCPQLSASPEINKDKKAHVKLENESVIRSKTTKLAAKRKSSVKTTARLLGVMRRSVVCAVVCIASDLASSAIVGFMLPKETAKSFTNTVYDINLMVNVLSLIFSFDTYNKIFQAPCLSTLKPRSLQRTTSMTNSSNNDESK